jgi:hypothetical protein
MGDAYPVMVHARECVCARETHDGIGARFEAMSRTRNCPQLRPPSEAAVIQQHKGYLGQTVVPDRDEMLRSLGSDGESLHNASMRGHAPDTLARRQVPHANLSVASARDELDQGLCGAHTAASVSAGLHLRVARAWRAPSAEPRSTRPHRRGPPWPPRTASQILCPASWR